MPHTADGSVEIYYETTGSPTEMPLVLIAGFGAQLIAWPDDLCEMLVAEGFFVIRMDNRDVGLSQKLGGPDDVDGGYELADMAQDVLRVLDVLGIDRAHLVGHSMGGMMAQVLAIDHPHRVHSLTLIATTPGQDPRFTLLGDLPELSAVQPRFTRDEVIEIAAILQSPAAGDRYPRDEEGVRTLAGIAYDRCYAPDGMPRQWAALRRAPERLEALRRVEAPTVVLHGREDANLHWSAAVAIAEAIDGAELHVFDGLGHRLPRELWPDVVAAIRRTAGRR